MPFDQLVPPRPGVKVRYTGHPPPLLQGTDQVRTSTGFTIGRSTPDGPRLFPAAATDRLTGAARRAVVEREADELEARRERDKRDCFDVMDWLRHAEATLEWSIGGRKDVRRIPPLYSVALQISATWSLGRLLGALNRLEQAGLLRLVTEAKGRRGAAIRLEGSSLILITIGFTEDVVFT